MPATWFLFMKGQTDLAIGSQLPGSRPSGPESFLDNATVRAVVGEARIPGVEVK